jgi:hydrogenase maturation protein HypF
LARIDSVTVSELSPSQIPAEKTEFRIVLSAVKGRVSTGIPADAATCLDCLHELLDPADRRYRYPFLNCTNCGPRFTITRRIPYDRPQTSMAKFPMCPACQREYDDPANRRFHAQPNACWECGPQVWLVGADGAEIATADPVHAAIERLKAGQIMAIKGIGGFHLSVDATNQAAVMLLRQRKRRHGKPLAVMVRDLEAAREVCVLTAAEEALLTTSARPIVLARLRSGSGIVEGVAPGIPWLGVFLPYAPLQHLLFADGCLRALVMTSANLSEEPIAIDNSEALARLGGIADAFLMHNRDILQRADDSVAAIVDGAPQLIRRARGFVPLGVELPLKLPGLELPGLKLPGLELPVELLQPSDQPSPFEAPPLLAVGGHLKNVFALARGRFVYQSQHLGDLENLIGLDFFRESLDHLMRTFEIEPKVVVHDLHPGYLSTQWAREWAAERGLALITVQHHHAHVAGCMAEYGLMGEAIGLALDGTGYGADGRIWGGEVLLCRPGSFERFAHLDYVPMPGGEAAIREPWRMALAGLRAAGFDALSAETLALVNATEKEARVLARMMERGLNSPPTSSLGRLFDGVAAVVLGRAKVNYEAQAAIELEGVAVDEPDGQTGYAMEIAGGNWAVREPSRICAGRLWRELVEDLRSGVSRARIAARFHAGVADGFVRAAVLARTAAGMNRVALSGGCMHNRRLARLLRTKLEVEGFEVFQHRRVSPGDGGLSYGQIAVAVARLRERG